MGDEAEGPNFFAQNEKFIVLALTVISFISLLSSLFIIVTYISFKKIRNYAYKLVVYLSIANILLNFGNILSIGTIQNEDEDSLCRTQAVLVNYGGLASILWTTVIAWSIFSATVLSAKNLREKNCRFIMFGYGVPVLLSIIPFATNQYGRSGFFCWIKSELTVADTALRMVEFYVPLWVSLAFNIYAYIKVVRFIKKYISTTLEIRFIHRLKYYPLILVFCWSFATINRIYTIFADEVVALTFLHVVFGGLQGLLNAIVFCTNDQVRQIWKEKLCNCCLATTYSRYSDSSLKKNEEMQQQQEQEENNEEIQNHNQDENNASVELAQQSDTSETKKRRRKNLKLTIQV